MDLADNEDYSDQGVAHETELSEAYLAATEVLRARGYAFCAEADRSALASLSESETR